MWLCPGTVAKATTMRGPRCPDQCGLTPELFAFVVASDRGRCAARCRHRGRAEAVRGIAGGDAEARRAEKRKKVPSLR
jgi:hypothetical protein